MSLRCKPGLGIGHYDLMDASGNVVGEVIKKIEHYNLIRAYTSIRWHPRISGHEFPSWGYERRKDAVAAAEAALTAPSSQESASEQSS